MKSDRFFLKPESEQEKREREERNDKLFAIYDYYGIEFRLDNNSGTLSYPEEKEDTLLVMLYAQQNRIDDLPEDVKERLLKFKQLKENIKEKE